MSIFTDLWVKPPKSSKFNLSHDVLLTTDFGKIIPIYLEDVVPGDRFKVSTEMAIKMLPTLAPIATGIEVRVDYFFVPNRLLWNDWEDFITGGTDGTVLPVAPTINGYTIGTRDTKIGSLWDYFGLPPTIPVNERGNFQELTMQKSLMHDVSALPFRAYDFIWNEYYRDENLQDELVWSKNSGIDDTTPLSLQYRGLKKDYFTSALPWAQRGPQVEIPLSGSAPVHRIDEESVGIGQINHSHIFSTDRGQEIVEDPKFYKNPANATQATIQGLASDDTYATLRHNHSLTSDTIADAIDDHFEADLSESSAISINELRRLNAVQRWLEKNARAGSRYVEQILSHFGVHTPDYRIDRPEYLGGNKSVIGMTEVLQTSESNESPQGNRAGVGFGASLNKSRRFYVQEHGWIIGLMSIIPQRNIYCDGVERKWMRSDKFDYYFPSFQYLGEQAIKKSELFAYGLQSEDNGDFGYTPRYAEYRYHPSGLRGAMRSNMAYWHLGRIFNTAPNLNGQFINSHSALDQYDRIFPTDEQLGDRFIVTMRNHVFARRPMSKNPNPSL